MATGPGGEERWVLPLVLPNDSRWNSETGLVEKIDGATRTGLSLVDEALEFIRSQTERLAVVSIVGDTRSGKSTICNYLIRNEDEPGSGFTLGHSFNACTMGIWLSKRLVPHRGEKNAAVLVLDVEGAEAVDGKKSEDTRLFLLAALVSSLFVYNSQQAFKANDVEKIAFITSLTQQLKDKEKVRGLAGQFLWLLRNTSLRPEINGARVTPTEYLHEKVLKREVADDYADDKEAASIGRRNRLRAHIKDFFSKMSAFTLPSPHADASVLSRLDQMSLTQLSKEFQNGVGNLKQTVFTKPLKELRPGMYIEGASFADLLTNYVEALNNKATTDIPNMLEAALQQRYRRLFDTVLSAYRLAMDGITADGPYNTDVLVAKHKETLGVVMAGVGADFGEGHVESREYLDRLYIEMGCAESQKLGQEGFLRTIFERNLHASEKFCTELYGQLMQPLQAIVDAPRPDYLLWAPEDLELRCGNMRRWYELKALGPAADGVWEGGQQRWRAALERWAEGYGRDRGEKAEREKTQAGMISEAYAQLQTVKELSSQQTVLSTRLELASRQISEAAERTKSEVGGLLERSLGAVREEQAALTGRLDEQLAGALRSVSDLRQEHQQQGEQVQLLSGSLHEVQAQVSDSVERRVGALEETLENCKQGMEAEIQQLRAESQAEKAQLQSQQSGDRDSVEAELRKLREENLQLREVVQRNQQQAATNEANLNSAMNQIKSFFESMTKNIQQMGLRAQPSNIRPQGSSGRRGAADWRGKPSD